MHLTSVGVFPCIMRWRSLLRFTLLASTTRSGDPSFRGRGLRHHPRKRSQQPYQAFRLPNEECGILL